MTIKQREKVKHKVTETRKKKQKQAKKNVQWKSSPLHFSYLMGEFGFLHHVRCVEHPKDPGIPNNFPYKDQILAEVAEQRRIVRVSSLSLCGLYSPGRTLKAGRTG